MDGCVDANSTELQFCWGKKGGVGGSKKSHQFYKSFTMDNISYSLFDCVYLYKDGITEPYIGKIVKMWEWENPKSKKKEKRAKILWFFRPSDIKNYLGDYAGSEKEIFLASGEGSGLFNINPLEAIAGKCSVICTAKDERNPQPSKEDLEMADYIFSCTFNVQNYTISKKIDDHIAGTEAKYLFNRIDDLKQRHVNNLEDNGISHNGEAGQSSTHPGAKDAPSDLGTKLNDNAKSASTSTFGNGEEVQAVLGIAQNGEAGQSFTHPGANDALEDPGTILNDKAKSASTSTFDNGEKVQAVLDEKTGREPMLLAKDKEIIVLRSSDLDKEDLKPSKMKAICDADEERPSKNAKLEEHSIKLAKDTQNDKEKLKEKKTNPSEKHEKKVTFENDEVPGIHTIEVTKKPDSDRSKWFKLPWILKLRKADEQGTLVLIENLDPSYTSSEIEGIINDIFNQSCTVKVIPQGSFQNPNYGQAYAIFKTRDAANMVVSRINQGCLLQPNGSPLICSKGMLDVSEQVRKGQNHRGHLVIDKVKLREEMKNAVSTSHCSQPNTIEYEMAAEWTVLHENFRRHANCLYKGQVKEQNLAKRNLMLK